MRCRRSPRKKHYGKGELKEAGAKGKRKKGYYFKRYGPGNRGHSWRLHGTRRVCIRCGYRPSTGKRMKYKELQEVLELIKDSDEV